MKDGLLGAAATPPGQPARARLPRRSAGGWSGESEAREQRVIIAATACKAIIISILHRLAEHLQRSP